jgi:hypothetical protein
MRLAKKPGFQPGPGSPGGIHRLRRSFDIYTQPEAAPFIVHELIFQQRYGEGRTPPSSKMRK